MKWHPNTSQKRLEGKRVRIIENSTYHRGDLIGAAGTVRSYWGSAGIGVKLDFYTNDNSKYGYFYFKISELEFIDEPKTNTEKGETQMPKITNYLNIAKIEFLDEQTAFRTFDYANFDPKLQAGDLCVVMTAHHGMALANVVEIEASKGEPLQREIVARVDMMDYYIRADLRKRAAELKAKMQERAKQLQDLVLYQTLAKEDPEMAQLLQDFKDLNV